MLIVKSFLLKDVLSSTYILG